ncbi:MAG: Nramp family divalent metal transporter [Candidatus Nomurabacteria bacterium]|nr:Nramp family divalent metal transporter [Candidatus Nomurabacteria bacterium]
MAKKKSIFEDVLEAPSIALEKTAEMAEKIEHSITDQKIIKGSGDYFKKLGPGLVSGAADDDPSGIATYSQTGAQYGTSLLWLAAWTFPLMAVIQEMCARIALVTGRGLASNIKSNYSKKILYFCTALLFLANTLNIGADLGAMAKAIQLILPMLNFTSLIIIIGLFGLLLQVFIPYQKYAGYLKWLSIALLSYVATGIIIHMDWSVLLHDAFIPNMHFGKSEILLVVGILGTTISPYLFFWETGQEVEEQIAEGKTTALSRKGTNDEEIKKMRIDIWSGMFLSNIVMFFIIAVCATTLFKNGITNIGTAADAAQALAPLAGQWAFLLFTIGIIGTGMLAIPVLAGSTSYAISECFGWKEGLYRKLNEARAFYGVIIISTILGIAINFIGIDPIKALIYSAIFNGMVAPVILFFIVRLSSNHKIMGKYKNSKLSSAVGWFIMIIMKIASVAAMISLIFG